jgi:Kef-type K+ transport system membrane component KefB
MGSIQTQLNTLFTNLAALGTGIVVGAATVAIIFGGLMWLFSAGSQRRVEHAQTTIMAGIGGLIIVVLANTIATGLRGVFGG